MSAWSNCPSIQKHAVGLTRDKLPLLRGKALKTLRWSGLFVLDISFLFLLAEQFISVLYSKRLLVQSETFFPSTFKTKKTLMGSNSNMNGLNGHADSIRRIPMEAGVYSPTMTFFQPDTEDLDLDAVARHSVRLAKAGLAGLVTMGSNGEAVHLSRDERTQVTQTTRKALDDAGFSHIPVICGASDQSIRGTIQLCNEGAAAGASYVLLVPPSYFRAAMDEERLEEYFLGVADGSPIPLVLYNYPGAVAGIDMTSDFIIKISKHPNIVGTKFTCGNTGKLTRVASTLDALTPSNKGSGYMAFGGMADFTLQTGISGGSGIIAGGANVLPRTCVKVWKLWEEGKLEEAIALQKVLSRGDWVLTKASVPGTKRSIEMEYGYGGHPRRPLKKVSKEDADNIKEGVEEVMKVERSLPDFGVPSKQWYVDRRLG